MSRPVAIRASYRNDAAFLLRLEAAVAKDERQGEEWRSSTCQSIRALAMRLLQADGKELVDEDRKPAVRSARRST